MHEKSSITSNTPQKSLISASIPGLVFLSAGLPFACCSFIIAGVLLAIQFHNCGHSPNTFMDSMKAFGKIVLHCFTAWHDKVRPSVVLTVGTSVSTALGSYASLIGVVAIGIAIKDSKKGVAAAKHSSHSSFTEW